MTKALLLFDIDGTLLSTRGMGMRAIRRAFGQLFGDGLNWEGINPGGSLDPLIFAEAARINGIKNADVHHARFRDVYIQELTNNLKTNRHRVEVMPGVHVLLAHLRERISEHGDAVLGLLTGNYAKAVPMKLATIGVDVSWFTVTAFGDEGAERAELVRLALDRYQLLTDEPADPGRVAVIGDTPRDVACAHAHGCVAFAVATGGYSVEELAACGADVVLKDLSDPTPLIDFIDGKTQTESRRVTES